MPLDYLTSNALNKYPFDDNATLKAADDTYLANDVFLDIIAVCKQPDMVGAYLKSLVIDTGDELFITTFQFVDDAGVDNESIELEIPFADVTDRGVYGLANTEAAVKIVFGVGAVELLESNISRTFTNAAGKLAQSAVILMAPRVTSISFTNWDKETNEAETSPLATFVGSETVEMDLTVREGSNMSIYLEDDKTIVEVISGAGTGLYDGCGEDELTIKTINDTGPDLNHNFLMVTDDCYTTTPVTNGLELNNICTPKCTGDQLASFAHYLNRVNDALLWLRNLASDTATTIREEIDYYNDVVVPAKNQPSFKAKFEKFSSVDAGKFYYSFAIGFLNPTGADLALEVDVTTSGVLVNTKFRIENATTILADGAVEQTVPCLKVGIVEFVVLAEIGDMVNVDGDFGTLPIAYEVTLS